MQDPLQPIKEELLEAIRDVKADEERTRLQKAKFISEIKSGLGNEIKTKASLVTKIEPTMFEKIRSFIRSIFTRF